MHWIDPESVPALSGTIACFTRNPRGEVDGALLDDGGQVHVPPHLGAAFEKMFAPGDAIEARGVRPRGGDVFAAVSVRNAAGKRLVDDGPPHPHHHGGPPKLKKKRPAVRPVELAGRVRRTLYAPKGEVSGAVLETGEQLRVDAKANAELAGYFVAGAEVRVWGEAFTRAGTTVVDVGEIGFAKDF